MAIAAKMAIKVNNFFIIIIFLYAKSVEREGTALNNRKLETEVVTKKLTVVVA
jgi:hypothetical protein